MVRKSDLRGITSFDHDSGWLDVLGWATGAANTAFLAALQIQGLLVFNYPEYVWHNWHGTLLCIAVVTFSAMFNILLARALPLVEGAILCIHTVGFFAVVITLWVLGPKGNASEVFTTFNNEGGWVSNGGSALVGIMAVVLPLLGGDSAVSGILMLNFHQKISNKFRYTCLRNYEMLLRTSLAQ